MSVYGYCPQNGCGQPVISRTRGIPSFDSCSRGHRYLAGLTLKAQAVTRYVCGFMFDPTGSLVVLVTKDRPAWQAGKLNGLGGKIEPQDASVHAAMAREFHEESGVSTQPADWEEFAVVRGPDFAVHMMRTFSDLWHRVHTMESEEVRWYSTKLLLAGDQKTVPSVPIMIPLALDRQGFGVVEFRRSAIDEAKAA